FDFEFNKAQPLSQYVPVRTDGDRIISFEMQGSGGASGSAVYFVFRYDGATSQYVNECGGPGSGFPACAQGVFTSMNGPNTAAGAWGSVDTHRNWTLAPMDQRMFAEASVP